MQNCQKVGHRFVFSPLYSDSQNPEEIEEIFLRNNYSIEICLRLLENKGIRLCRSLTSGLDFFFNDTSLSNALFKSGHCITAAKKITEKKAPQFAVSDNMWEMWDTRRNG